MDHAKGLAGIVVDETKISSTKNEKLTYAGYSVEEIAKAHASFEEVVFLLWYTRLPSEDELREFRRDLVSKMVLPAETIRLLLYIAKEPQHPMSILRTTTSLLGTTNDVDHDEPPKILAKMLTAIAAIIRIRDDEPFLDVDPELGVADNFLYMMTGKKPNAELSQMFNTVMILHADHEFNASTFTARVVASTMSDYYSCLTAAVCALKGPLHGGANERVFEMLNEIMSQDEDPIDFIKNEIGRGRKIMGFGHRIYKHGDPRAYILKDIAEKLAEETDNMDYYNIQQQLADYMLEKDHLHPNVDYYTALIYHCLGLEKETFTLVFAACRTSGWLAHVMEQRREKTLIRPNSEYVGPTNRSYLEDTAVKEAR
ncbi:citrate/2-methylcitrate synthase [Companilactobacillus mishanensis]|uniref:Citrate synthase n=1 Tax=Companilactobacillus mishanensis TaxID=2486008 RepID=A0A5P0ZJJ0_9LACO|nr:citrate/2-methylcitrate synthase [Companilactobacillus mishanensis]MQS53175.1 methylcitrate synthase [Companilactobacillus mishanensis]MQS90086.1 methylcitrate synthase [Companilactobacillus mishanensis]